MQAERLFLHLRKANSMRKFLLTLQLTVAAGIYTAGAQNLYSLNGTFLDLDNNYEKVDSSAPEANFKTAGKYASRFKVVNLTGTVPTSGTYKERPFRIVDGNHIGYKVTAASREINSQTNPEEEVLDNVPGNHFLFDIPDGIVMVQRFEGDLGYRVSRFDEWCKPKYKQRIPHTNVVEKNGTEFKQPYMFYLTHTDRFMVFSSTGSRDIHQATIIDLKDGKMNQVSATVCGVVRADNEIAYEGYIIRDEAAKTLKVSMKKGNWAIKEANAGKVLAESIVDDSVFIMARYYKGVPGISLAAFNAQSGKVLWVGEVKQATAAPSILYLTRYKDQLLMEASNGNTSYLEAFDIKTGKRTHSTL
jgi:hypothetical protein